MVENKTNKELAFEGIKELVEKFENNYKQFYASDYNETLTRQDFINPFFEYLGWDISNKQGYSQTYREVIHEDKLKINRETKSPDYSFRIGGNRVFFVEAKKPSLNLKEDSDAAYQVKRYAWSGKLAVSILTDFEEFAIYDCSKKPSPNDKASMSRIEYINYKDYLNRFDFLYDTFAKENVLKGSLEKYNAETKNKKGTESVDIDFLNSLDNLRTKLASSISKLNGLSERDLNFAVQHIIDRIIFLRVAEDRGVENYGDLREACAGENYYKNIVEIFKKADGKYNSGIFDFRKDEITQDIKVDNKIIKEIINDLYYPKSPYEFSVISVEIIGNAYEQFLGKTITIGNNHKAKIELKPEVRKAGGVYYTPEYIVDYIVENTVGEKIKNKSPKEISNIKIVDPACGSGSFLLGAYKYLLNYHREYYSKQGKKKFLGSKEDAITEDGDLALWVKKQILINNIFGVDIDSNAVEVTKLSLLLKCMEGETPASIMNNQSLFNERALPSLDENIKCGNSLIGNDFYSAGDSLNIDIETQYKINCFDWEKEFSSIFKNGGFDIVIGNPPYFNIETLGHNSIIANYIKEKYLDIWQNKSDILFYFLHKAVKISKSYVGFIISNSFLFADRADKLRNFILDNTNIKKIVNFEKVRIFKDASITTSIIICDKNNNDDTKALILKDKTYNNIISIINDNSLYFDVKLNRNSSYILQKKDLLVLLNKINHNSKLLQDILYVGSGMKMGTNKVYQFSEIPNDFPKEYIKQRMSGEMISRYYTAPTKEYVLYIEDIPDFKKLPIEIQKYLISNKEVLEKRESVSIGGRLWWKYSHSIHKELYNYNKIWTSYRGAENKFTLDETSDFIGFTNTTVIFQTNENINLKYILGILNSKLLNFYHHKIAKQTGGGIFEYVSSIVGKLPIKILDIQNKKSDKEIHDKLVNLVDSIIEINKKLNNEKNPDSATMLRRQVQSIDDNIDKIVYGLYGLSEEEIKVVEGGD